MQARISTHLPDPQKVDPQEREELSIEDAAIRVAALKGSATLANSQAFTGSEQERRERAKALQGLREGVTVTTGERSTPKPKVKRRGEVTDADLDADLEFEEWRAEFELREAEEALSVDEWLEEDELLAQDEDEGEVSAMSDDEWQSWLASQRTGGHF